MSPADTLKIATLPSPWYLGTVIVTNVASAQWHAWPNGHPVVRLGDGTELDVVALADHSDPDDDGALSAIYQGAVSR